MPRQVDARHNTIRQYSMRSNKPRKREKLNVFYIFFYFVNVFYIFFYFVNVFYIFLFNIIWATQLFS